MKGDHTMCALVGDNRTEGLVVARLSTRQRTHLIVAVKEAKPLIPISYLIRIAHYRATWRMMGEHDCFQMNRWIWRSCTMVNEDEDLLYVGKATLWRIGYDLYNSALRFHWNDLARRVDCTYWRGSPDTEHLRDPSSIQCGFRRNCTILETSLLIRENLSAGTVIAL